MTELESLVALNMIEGIGPIIITRLVESFGSARKALSAQRRELLQVEGIGPELTDRIRGWKETTDVAGELQKIENGRFKIISMSNPSYPNCLKEIYDPPPLLYVKGELREEDNHAIAIVGARRCSHYGRMCAERLAAQLARLGCTVVSGLARGIDTAAHRGALGAKGRTIAVLGSGLDRIYPAENKALVEEIAASGAVLSEFPLGTLPQKKHFPLRNRLISGLSIGVVVVEAARRSGSLITAAQALEQGRSVFAVPGRIDSYASKGTHALIKDGAKLVESVEDICEEFAYLFPGDERPPAVAGTASRPQPRLSRDEEIVLSQLSSRERPIDEITRECGLPPSVVSATLLSLEVKHLIEQLPGKMFRRAL
jgi:DNA processing protein